MSSAPENWLVVLGQALEGDMPVLRCDQSLPENTTWWNAMSLPVVHCSPDALEGAYAGFLAAFGEVGLLVEGDA